MTTNAIPAYGTLLKLGDGGGPETFTTIMELTKIGGPKLSLKEEDATHHGSDGWEEVIGTILSGGEIPVEANWIPSDATQNKTTGVLAQLLGRTKKNWKMVLPDSAVTTFSFKAIVKGFEGDADVTSKLKLNFTLKISGPVTVS
jgi:hypothetical protein